MRYSINSHGISAQAKGWGHGWPANRAHDMARVKADRSGTSINVHKRIARLVDMLLDETERRGYRLNPHKCGGYVCRQIFGNVTGRPAAPATTPGSGHRPQLQIQCGTLGR
jgi:hypothetical protein